MKEFKPTSWAIDNRTTIFIITILLTFAGIMSYNALPKEQNIGYPAAPVEEVKDKRGTYLYPEGFQKRTARRP